MGPTALPRAPVKECVKTRQGNSSRDFPGGPGVKTMGSQCGKRGFHSQKLRAHKTTLLGISLVVQGLRLWAPSMGRVASVPSQELRAHMPLVHACSISSVRKKKVSYNFTTRWTRNQGWGNRLSSLSHKWMVLLWILASLTPVVFEQKLSL